MYNANQEEQEILKYWDKTKAFEKSVNNRPEKKPYVFYDGPPFATGLPHYGHILSSVIKDVVPRYWTMKGYRVRRRWGWDCHGLPIENLIEKKLKISGKKEIENIGIEQFNAECRSMVLTYTQEWKKMVDRIGRWVEFDNAYKTMDPTYMESVWFALKSIWDKGLIYEGRKVLMYCPRCETPVSKAEVAMDNSYKDLTEEAVTVKFRIKNQESRIKERFSDDEPVYILAWTTTPWTLPGNVALAVGRDIEYLILNIENEKESIIIAKDRLEAVVGNRKYEIRNKVKGSDLVGLEYEPLFNLPAVLATGKKAYYVAPADFVTTDEGTGVVHTAVIYGEDDYNLGVKINLPMVPMLNERGEYNEAAPALARGKYFKQGEKDIKKDLEERGLIFDRSQNTHSYPHCWRCETPLIYNAISAWFINIQKVKARLLKLNKKINWYPEHLKYGRFQNILETAPDWNISRNRYWATPLPFWKCTNVRNTKATKNMKATAESKCDNVVCIGSVNELKKKAINFSEVFPSDNVAELDLHKHIVDRIKLKCEACGGIMERIPEVIDCWVESASMPFAEWHYPFENKKVFEARFPGQYIAEYIAQTRAWFYYMHALAALLFNNISFENVVTTGTVLNEKGEKLSKSKQNYPDPWKIIETYGVDALRFYLMTSVVMQADDLLFNEREVRETYNKVINILWNVVTFYLMYASESQKSKVKSQKSKNILDRWILAKQQALVKEVTENMDNYNTVKAGRPIKDFIDDLSTWYLRRSRERFKRTTAKDTGELSASPDNQDKQFALATLHEVLLTLSKLMAPFTPFIAEKIYQILRTPNSELRTLESVHLEDWPKADEIAHENRVVLHEMDLARKIVELGLALRAEQKIRVRQPLQALTINKAELSHQVLGIIADELNVKEVTVADKIMDKGWVTKEEGGLIVWLNTTLTDELKKEGLAREIVRTINQMRKEQKLTIADRVMVKYHTRSELLRSVFQDPNGEIKKSTLADELAEDEKTAGVEVEIDGEKVVVEVTKNS